MPRTASRSIDLTHRRLSSRGSETRGSPPPVSATDAMLLRSWRCLRNSGDGPVTHSKWYLGDDEEHLSIQSGRVEEEWRFFCTAVPETRARFFLLRLKERPACSPALPHVRK